MFRQITCKSFLLHAEEINRKKEANLNIILVVKMISILCFAVSTSVKLFSS